MNKSNLIPTLLALFGFGAMLSSCTSAPRGTGTNTYSVGSSGEVEESIGDKDLAAKFVLLGIKSESQEGRLRVQFDLKNKTHADLAFEWTAKWKDASGFNVDTNTHWRPTIVTGQGFQPIQLVAPTKDAVSFQLEFRRPTPVR